MTRTPFFTKLIASLANPLWLRRGLHNLNNTVLFNNGWGRDPEPPKADGAAPAPSAEQAPKPSSPPAEQPADQGAQPPPNANAGTGGGGSNGGKPPKRGDEPPDLEQVWREFNEKISQLFGGKPKQKRPSSADLGPRKDANPNQQPAQTGDTATGNEPSAQNNTSNGARNPMRGIRRPQAPNGQAVAAIGVLLILVVGIIWLATGFYVVQEGKKAVVTQFGRYVETTHAGLHWRLPYPIQDDQRVDVSTMRRVEIGTKAKSGAARLKEALMLTGDENIVDIQFEVQYRIKEDGAPGFLFSNKFDERNPEATVKQAAESAMREEVGRRTIDEVLNKSRQDVAKAVEKRMQGILDRYKIRRTDVVKTDKEAYFDSGILITTVAILNAQPPELVQAAFDDAVKAVQDKERAISEGQAYANDVVPRAKGAASRLVSEAEGYKQRVSQSAEGDAARFKSVVTEYAKAPAVTRQRMYLDTMQQVFQSTSKVVVDTKGSGNMLYLPLDKIIAQTTADSQRAATSAPEAAVGSAAAQAAIPQANVTTMVKDASTKMREARESR
jgi:modulator of FtsH protease HflK